MTAPGDSATLPAFFIVGVGRSGTTLARAILTGHPHLVVPSETGFVPALLRAAPLWWNGSGVRSGLFVRLAFANGRLARAGVDPAQLRRRLARRPPASTAEAIGRIYELFSKGDGSVRVGDKTPSYGLHVERLARAFPHAQFIHMVRHPLDVVASLRRQPWGPNDPMAAAGMWLRGMRAVSDSTLRADRLLTVRLEDLIAEPDAIVDRLARHLRVDSHADMLRFSERAHEISHQNVHPESHLGLGGSLAPTRDWREGLVGGEARGVWSLVVDSAAPLGYSGPPGPGPRVSEAAAMRRLRMFELSRSWRRLRTLGHVVGGRA
ncbi:MAG: sulfotransferase [Propionibacteriales bacterium]|nr:sulfotransferase [Propionibacteriales bacterium]